MDKTSFFTLLGMYQREHKHLRKGQAVFNLMSLIDKNKVSKLVGTDKDPFYDDNKVDAFLEECFK